METHGKMTFSCPHCGQKLSFLDGAIIKMVGRLKATTFSCKTMFYFSATLGQHGCIVGEGVRVFDGAKVEYECINHACKRNLTAPYNDELAEIIGTDEAGNEFRVVFNKVYGKDSTFVLDMQARKVTASYGGDKDVIFSDVHERRRNFFGEGE
jgi:hypothetical protein